MNCAHELQEHVRIYFHYALYPLDLPAAIGDAASNMTAALESSVQIPELFTMMVNLETQDKCF